MSDKGSNTDQLDALTTHCKSKQVCVRLQAAGAVSLLQMTGGQAIGPHFDYITNT